MSKYLDEALEITKKEDYELQDLVALEKLADQAPDAEQEYFGDLIASVQMIIEVETDERQ